MKHTVKVEFQTSEIIVKDWIGIDEFLAQAGPDYSILNFESGRVKSTEDAANLGFVRVHISDVGAKVYRKDNDFSFGLARDKKEYDNIGYVDAGVWAVTMIEKQKLVDIVANKTGKEKAQEIVDDYLNSKQHQIVHVEPGMYTLKFDSTNTKANEIFSLKKDKVAKTKKMKM